jgi:hypothetical protein
MDLKALFTKNRKALAALLALLLVMITGGVITLSPNTGEEVEIEIPALGDDDDSAPGDDDSAGDDDSGA